MQRVSSESLDDLVALSDDRCSSYWKREIFRGWASKNRCSVFRVTKENTWCGVDIVAFFSHFNGFLETAPKLVLSGKQKRISRYFSAQSKYLVPLLCALVSISLVVIDLNLSLSITQPGFRSSISALSL